MDLGLRVVVHQAAGTLIAFQSNFYHGTTRLFGAKNSLISINFSSHILEAYEKAQMGTTIERVFKEEYSEEKIDCGDDL